MSWLVRTSRALKFLLWIVLVALGIATAVGLTTLAQFGADKSEIAKLRAELWVVNERLSRLEKNASQFSAPNSGNQNAAAIQPLHPAAPSLSLTNDEASLIRYFIKLPPPQPGATASIVIGDQIPEARLMPLPEVIAEKVPKLRGSRFTTDRNQAIVIVGGKNRAEAIVAPN